MLAAVATSFGNIGIALAGPTLSSLTNLTNSGETTVSNTLGQSFSVSGDLRYIVPQDIWVFRPDGRADLLQTGSVRFSAGDNSNSLGLNPILGATAGSFNSVIGQASGATIARGVISLGTEVIGITLRASSSVSTVGAAISNTVFGPSNVKASSAFTNQVTNSLTAF